MSALAGPALTFSFPRLSSTLFFSICLAEVLRQRVFSTTPWWKGVYNKVRTSTQLLIVVHCACALAVLVGRAQFRSTPDWVWWVKLVAGIALIAYQTLLMHLLYLKIRVVSAPITKRTGLLQYISLGAIGVRLALSIGYFGIFAYCLHYNFARSIVNEVRLVANAINGVANAFYLVYVCGGQLLFIYGISKSVSAVQEAATGSATSSGGFFARFLPVPSANDAARRTMATATRTNTHGGTAEGGSPSKANNKRPMSGIEAADQQPTGISREQAIRTITHILVSLILSLTALVLILVTIPNELHHSVGIAFISLTSSYLLFIHAVQDVDYLPGQAAAAAKTARQSGQNY